MDFTKYVIDWIKEEITQGKVTLIFGIIALITCFFIWKNGSELIKGMLIPLLLVTTFGIGYGSYLLIRRPIQQNTMVKSIQESPKSTFQEEETRILKELKNFIIFKIMWVTMIVFSLALIYMSSQSYYKGVALGLLILGSVLMITETVMQDRMMIYYQNIKKLSSNL